MKTIQDRYEKKDIQNLPRALFEGRIIVIFSEAEADKAVDYLMAQKILGVDTETRPSFKRAKFTKFRYCKFPPMTLVFYSGSIR